MARVARKPVGGLTAALLIPIGSVTTASIFSAHCTELAWRADAHTVNCPLLDDRSSYREETVATGGLSMVRHTLTLMVSREQGQLLFTQEWLATCATEGVIAQITAADGEMLLIGYSQHLGDEQPLRFKSLVTEIGKKRTDLPLSILTLYSEDTEPASTYDNQ
ncbi:MAG: hypothetical protein RR037_02690 [Alistipes sp.]